MIIRTLLHRKLIQRNKIKLETNKEVLHYLEHVQKIPEDELLKVREDISKYEEQLIKYEKSQAKLCDLADIALYSFIAQLISNLNGFELGVIIAESISLFAMIYGFAIIKNLTRYLYVPLSITISISLSYKIVQYLQ